jgi:hypothetical protein
MNAKRLYLALVGTVCLGLLLLLGGTYLANTVLQGQAKQLADAKTNNAVLDAKQTQLAKARGDIQTYKDLGDIAKSIVPQDKDQAQTVREIVNIANNNGIRLGALTFPASTLGAAGAAGAKPNNSQLVPVKNIGGVYSLDIVVQSDTNAPISYDRFTTFLDALEHNRRTALVKGVTIQPAADNPALLSFTLNVSEYVKP